VLALCTVLCFKSACTLLSGAISWQWDSPVSPSCERTVMSFHVQVRGIRGIDKLKNEIKYDAFWQRVTLEEEAVFGNGMFKMKGAVSTKTVCLCSHMITPRSNRHRV
jgi:hypothetical protein